MLDSRDQLRPGHAVARQLVGDHHAAALPLQQLAKQPFGCPLVAPALDQYVEDQPCSVDRAPEPVLDATDPDRDLVEVPLVPKARQPAQDPIGELLPALQGAVGAPSRG